MNINKLYEKLDYLGSIEHGDVIINGLLCRFSQFLIFVYPSNTKKYISNNNPNIL